MFIGHQKIDNSASLRKVTLAYRLEKEDRLAERLLLLKEMLIIAPNYDGAKIEKYADLHLDYDVFDYGDSYLFCISASQVTSKNLSYVFSSPYGAADKLMLQLLQKGFYNDERSLDVAKRKLSRENRERRRSGLYSGLSYSNVPLSVPVVSASSIQSLTLKDAYYPLALINGCHDGTIFYFGNEKRKPEFENPFISFTNSRDYNLSSFKGDFLDSECLFISVKHDESKTSEDVRIARAACFALSEKIQEDAGKVLRRRIDFSVMPLDGTHSLLTCHFLNNTLSLIRKSLGVEKGYSLSNLSERDLGNVVLQDTGKNILALSDPQIEYSVFFNDSLLGVKDGSERKTGNEFAESVKNCLSTAVIEDVSMTLFTEERI